MRFAVLGSLVVTADDGREVRLPETKVRALLADLIVHRGRDAPADRLIDDLWGPALPTDPANTLQTKVSQLRRRLGQAEAGGRALVAYRAPGYLLGDAAVDADEFTALVERARAAADPRAKAALFADALALWRGPAYAEFRDEPFARNAARALEELRLTVVEEQAEARLELGDHARLADDLLPVVAEHPLRERLRLAHLTALYRSGRQSEALDQYERLRRALADDLGVDPSPDLAALHLAILGHDPALAAAAPVRERRPNLPTPLTDLIGREREVAAARDALDAGRLVTITGPGGVGKTRLAYAAAAGASDRAWTVELAAVRPTGPEALADLVLTALGVRGDDPDRPRGMPSPTAIERLTGVLHGRETLLVLDNCEHVIEPVAEVVARLLAEVPDLRVLTTSQEALAIAGETLLTLGPLAPDAAAALFEARAHTPAGPGDAGWIRTVCERLDGLPLALELAAARVRAFGYKGVAERLDDRFALLSGTSRGRPARQRTLRAVIDWSWDQLDDAQRLVLCALAGHPGGAAIDVPDVEPDLIEQLVARSMVVAEPGPDGDMRYRLLESIAAYGRERLAQCQDGAAMLDRRDAHYARLAERIDLCGPSLRRWLHRLDQEAPNLVAVVERRADPGLTVCLSWYWYLRGEHRQARRHLAAVREDPDAAVWERAFALLVGDASGPEPDALAQAGPRAHWFLAAAQLYRGDAAAARPLLALAESRSSGDRWGEAASLAARAKQLVFQGDLDAGVRAATESFERFGALGDEWGRLQATELLGHHAEITGDYDTAARLHREGLRTCEAFGLWAEASCRISSLARIALLTGDAAESERLHAHGRAVAAEHAAPFAEDYARVGQALVARRRGALDGAEALLRESLAWHRRLQSGHQSPYYGITLVLVELGFVHELRGDAAAARSRHGEALTAARTLGDPRAVALATEGLAGVAALEGDHAEAERLLAEAAALRASVGAPLPPAERGDVERIEARLRRVLR